MNLSTNINTFKIKHKIIDSEVDINENLKISKILSFFQDIANMHSRILGCSRETIMEKFNLFWAAMRLRFETISWPKNNDEVYIETFPRKPGVRYDREFFIKDLKDNVLIKASSVWLLVDNAKRELIVKDVVDVDEELNFRTDYALNYKLKNIKTPEKLTRIYKREIKFSDIDMNKHVNNAIYSDIILDAIPFSFVVDKKILSFEINYLSEIKHGDFIDVYSDFEVDSINDEFYFEGIVKDDKKFKASIKFA